MLVNHRKLRLQRRTPLQIIRNISTRIQIIIRLTCVRTVTHPPHVLQKAIRSLAWDDKGEIRNISDGVAGSLASKLRIIRRAFVHAGLKAIDGESLDVVDEVGGTRAAGRAPRRADVVGVAFFGEGRGRVDEGCGVFVRGGAGVAAEGCEARCAAGHSW